MSFGVIGDDFAREAHRLVGDHVQTGDIAFAGEVFPVGPGVDGADRDDGAHLVDGGDHPTARRVGEPDRGLWRRVVLAHVQAALVNWGIMIRSGGGVSRLGPVVDRDGHRR